MTLARATSIAFACLLASCDLGTPTPSLAASVSANALPTRTSPLASDAVVVTPVGSVQAYQIGLGGVLGFVRSYPAGIQCDGVHDDTAAIQAALSSGVSFDLPPGVCVTSATLTVNSTANHGQMMRGAGAPAADGAGAGKTILRPTSAVATFLTIDGSPFGGYIEGFAVEQLGLDMTNMAAGAKGFSQLQAYDQRYAKVRVFNDSRKTSWNFGPGAYTTVLDSVQGNLVYCLGNGTNNPTTITLVGPDINGLNVEQCANVTSIGGAIQPAWTGSNTIVYLAPGTAGLYGFGPIPSTGIYLALGAYMLNAQFVTTTGTDWEALSQPPATCAVTGWTFGTYNDGTHGCAPIVMAARIDASVKNVNLANSTFAGMYLYSPGGANISLPGFQTGGGQGNYFDGRQSYLAGINISNGSAIRLFSDFQQSVGTGIIDASTGSAVFYGGVTGASLTVNGYAGMQSIGVQAAANGNYANFVDKNGHPEFGCASTGARATNSCYAGTLVLFNDDGGTQSTITLNAAGSVTVHPIADGNILAIQTAAGTGALTVTTAASTGSILIQTPGVVQAGSFNGGGATGVSCTGAPTAAFASSGGIVTHC